jgi:hypothetical protein
MATNRTRRTRDRVIGSGGLTESALSYFWWGGTISNDWAKGKTFDEIMVFWKEHREAIIKWYIEKNHSRNGEPRKRPSFLWYELELQKKGRRKTGTHKWVGPVRGDGGDRTITDDVFESDLRYLKRLGLPLEEWERTKA